MLGPFLLAAPASSAQSASSSSPGAWAWSKSSIAVMLEVLSLTDGAIEVPGGITHVVVEIGTSNHGRAWTEPFKYHINGIQKGVPLANQSHVLLLAFEPLLDKWAQYLSLPGLDAPFERPTAPGWAEPGRAIVLPFAVGASEGSADFHVSLSDGCSSLLPIDAGQMDLRAYPGRWGGTMRRFFRAKCGQTHSKRRVPVVSLRTILAEWLRGRRVDLLKVDAQGARGARLATTCLGRSLCT